MPGQVVDATKGAARWTWDIYLALAVFVATAAGSAYTLFKLAEHTGWITWLAWVPFASLDLSGIYFGHNWIAGRTAQIRVWGKVSTLLAVALSVAGNGLEHAISAGYIRPTLWVTIAVGSVPALVLFGVVHQLSLAMLHAAKQAAAEEAKRQAAEAKKQAATAKQAKPTPAPVLQPAAAQNEVTSQKTRRSDRVEWLRRKLEHSPEMSWSDQIEAIRDEFGVSARTAARVIEAARAAS